MSEIAIIESFMLGLIIGGFERYTLNHFAGKDIKTGKSICLILQYSGSTRIMYWNEAHRFAIKSI